MRSSAMSSDPALLGEPGLGGIRVGGLTRGSFILRGALAAAAMYGAGAATPFVRDALAQSDASDSAILDFALRLEILEAKFYDEALVKVPDMSSALRHVIQDVRDHEHQHASTINETILQLGISTSQPPKIDFGDAFTDQARFLAVAKGLEDTGVAAYNGATPKLFAATIVALVGTIVQVEARHAALIRDFLGEPIADGAFDKPLDESQVTQRVKPFITG
jgi:Ferritin-like domain